MIEVASQVSENDELLLKGTGKKMTRFLEIELDSYSILCLKKNLKGDRSKCKR